MRVMSRLSYDGYCAGIIAQTDQLKSAIQGVPFTVGQEVALDAIDEWMELGSLPMHFDVHPWMRELLGPGRTLHLHATDTPPELSADWVIDPTGDVIAWRRAH